jgi:hypothetical protein
MTPPIRTEGEGITDLRKSTHEIRDRVAEDKKRAKMIEK